MCCFFLPLCVLINVKGQVGELEGGANGLY